MLPWRPGPIQKSHVQGPCLYGRTNPVAFAQKNSKRKPSEAEDVRRFLLQIKTCVRGSIIWLVWWTFCSMITRLISFFRFDQIKPNSSTPDENRHRQTWSKLMEMHERRVVIRIKPMSDHNCPGTVWLISLSDNKQELNQTWSAIWIQTDSIQILWVKQWDVTC